MALCLPGRGRKLPPELPAGPERQQEAGHRNHDSAAGAGDDWVHDLQRRHDGGLVRRQPASAVRDGEMGLDGGGVQGGELDGACAAAAGARSGEEDAAATTSVRGQSPRPRWVRLADRSRGSSIGLAARLLVSLHHMNAGRLDRITCTMQQPVSPCSL